MLKIEGTQNYEKHFKERLEQLKKPIDRKHIKQREGYTDRRGVKHSFDYVSWDSIADMLDVIAPTWEHSVKSITQIGDLVAVTCSLTIDGVTREGVGTGTAETETGIKKAEHDGLKRAAIKFGLGRELYKKEAELIERTGAARTSGPLLKPSDPLAKTAADLITPSQLGLIRKLAKESGLDERDECQHYFHCKLEEVSKIAASWLISQLKDPQPTEASQPMEGQPVSAAGDLQASDSKNDPAPITRAQLSAISNLWLKLKNKGLAEAEILRQELNSLKKQNVEELSAFEAGNFINRLQELLKG